MRRLICALLLLGLSCLPCFADYFPTAIPPYRLYGKTELDSPERYKDLKAQLAAAPYNSRYLLDLAEIESHMYDLDQAFKHAQSAALAAPNDCRTHALLARLYLMDRNALSARLQSERALELATDKADKKEIFCLLITALIDLRQYAKADKLTRVELKRQPNDANIAFCRAFALSYLGTPEAAIAAYRQALQLDPSLVEAHYNLALLLSQAGDSKEATKEARLCQEGSPANSTAKLAEELISRLADQH